MSETLPLFPLGTVLFPGLLLPLHIFEDRYRQLVRDLMDGPEPRQFAVVAIRHGRETGVDGIQATERPAIPGGGRPGGCPGATASRPRRRLPPRPGPGENGSL